MTRQIKTENEKKDFFELKIGDIKTQSLNGVTFSILFNKSLKIFYYVNVYSGGPAVKR